MKMYIVHLIDFIIIWWNEMENELKYCEVQFLLHTVYEYFISIVPTRGCLIVYEIS